MKNLLTYLGIISLTLFSFYYTNKVALMDINDDQIMINIMKETENDRKCSEGFITNEGVVLGYDGRKIDKEKSYNNMRISGFNKELLVFNTIPCIINKKDYIDKNIIMGNTEKNAVSFLINVNRLNSSLKDLENHQKIRLSYIVGDKEIKKYKKDFIEGKYEIIYKGNNKKMLKEYIDITKKINITPYCISNYVDNIKVCSKKGVNIVKASTEINEHVFDNGKKNTKRGSFIIIEENKKNIEELNILINYTKNKGYNILSINEHLD